MRTCKSQDQHQKNITPQVGRQAQAGKSLGPWTLWRVDVPAPRASSSPQWLTLNCGTDIGMAVTQNSVLGNASAIPSIHHAMKFQVLSMRRAHPVDEASTLRGVIDMEDLGTLGIKSRWPSVRR